MPLRWRRLYRGTNMRALLIDFLFPFTSTFSNVPRVGFALVDLKYHDNSPHKTETLCSLETELCLLYLTYLMKMRQSKPK
ncbi:hypothetical protein B0T19DRAFT_3691 [Cercophora scortea]|uniref:Uncharacterized protein n=1 Tax=Cercophora scortea TaxID=314031 RepID=A0AAE0J230_9PEZI|nr:hypothetical protein B0T19DRAFT_3691 [Cercophora scortea]